MKISWLVGFFRAVFAVGCAFVCASSGFGQAPSITAPQLSRIAMVGQAVSFTTVASGAGPLSYQWIRQGQNIAGATDAVLTLPNVTLADRGWYQVIVSNSAGIASSVFMFDVGLSNATVVGWGENSYNETVPPPGLTEVVAVVGGFHRTVALKLNGTVTAWGESWGSIPNGLAGVVGVTVGGRHTLVVKSDGAVQTWGNYVEAGQLNIPAGLASVVGVAAGWGHSVALRADGTVVAWGVNSNGQTDVPAGLANVAKVAAGEEHSIALKTDGTVVMWGRGGAISAVPPGLGNVVDIACGTQHTLALKPDGTVVAWGNDVYGQATVPAGLSGVVALAAGLQHSLALKSDGAVVTWGSGGYRTMDPPAGLANCIGIGAGPYHSLALVPLTPPEILTQPLGNTVYAGSNFILSVVASGTVPQFQWLKNGFKLPNGGNIAGAQTATLTVSNVQSLDVGDYSVEVTNMAGAVTSNIASLAVQVAPGGPPVLTSWPLSQRVMAGQPTSFSVGTNDPGPHTLQWKRNGQVIAGATATTLSLLAPQLSDRGNYEVAVTNGAARTTRSYFELDVTLADAVLIAWGRVANGYPTPSPGGLRGLAAVSMSDNHFFGLKSDGTVIAWGPPGSLGETTIPANLRNVTAVAAGGAHTLALVADGTVVEWGTGYGGPRNMPPGLTNVVRVFAGQFRSAALRADGSLVSWGDNDYTTEPPPNLGPVVDLVLGSRYTIALRPDGTLVGWGRADGDELKIPVGLDSVVALAGRVGKSLALRADGSVVAWGWGAPSIPSGTVGIQAVATGDYHDLLLRADGTVLQIGSLPPPAGLSDVATISAGTLGALALVPPRAPRIDEQPLTQHAAAGATATFTVAASGTVPLTYQWHLGGRAIDGATSATLTLVNAQIEQTGEYTVTISNLFGTVTSHVALLAGFNPAPTVTSPPQSVSVVAGQGLALSALAVGTGGLTYQWRRDGTTVPGATQATLNLGPATLPLSGSYDVVVADGLSFTVSPAAMVLVAPRAYPQVVDADPSIATAFEVIGGQVTNFVRLPGGKVLVVGAFSRVHGASGRNIGLLRADGSGDPSFVSTAIDGVINVAAVQSDGRIIIGGAFTQVGGQLRAGLARLESNGALDPSFRPTENFQGINALALQATGRIVVGGSFASRLARVNSDGSTDLLFGPAPNAPVLALLALADGRIVAGGSFTQIAGQSANRIARLTNDGGFDASFATGAGFNNTVRALRISGDDNIMVGGSFTSFDGTTAGRIIKLSPTGVTASGWSTNSGFNAAVFALEVRGDGKILAAGSFSTFNGLPFRAVARLEMNGALDTAFRPTQFSEPPLAVTYLDNGSVIAGGAFAAFATPAYLQGIALMNAAGVVSATHAPGLMQPSSVGKIARLPDGRVVAAGPFYYVNGVSARYLARINVDGSLDATFSKDVIGSTVDDLVVQPDGKLVVVGEFDFYNGTPTRRVARINLDGTIDAAFRAGDALSATPDRIALMPGGGLLLAARSLPKYYGSSSRRDTLLVIKPNGVIDASFAAVPVPSGEITAMIVQLDGKITVGGSFTNFNGAPADFIVRLLPSGVRDPDFIAGANDSVRALALQPDGKILLAGDFTAVNAVGRARLARVNPAGNLDDTFYPQFELSGSPSLLQLEPSGKIFISGNFDALSSEPTLRYLIRVQPTGALDPTFVAPGLAAPIADLALTENGALWLAGGDLQIGGVARPGLLRTLSSTGAVILAHPSSQAVPAGGSVTINVTVAGAQSIAYQWLKDGVAIAGATSPALSFPAFQMTDAGSYIARITHPGGTIYSTPATLTLSSDVAFVTSTVLGTWRNDFSGWVGMQIAVAGTPVTVSQLGRIVAPGNTGTHTVKLVKASDGSDVPGGAVTIATSGGTPGQFRYTRLISPVTLAANTTYWLVSQETQGGDGWYDSDTTATTTAVAADTGYVWSTGPGTWGTYAIPNRGAIPVNFVYTPPPTNATEFVTHVGFGTLRNNFSGWVGMQIAVAGTPVAVSQLGRIVAPGNSSTHAVKLVTASDGLDVPGGAVAVSTSAGTVGQFQYGNLSSPITLAANTTYWLVSEETAGGDGWYDADMTVTTTGVAADIGYVWSAGPGIWGTFSIANRGAVGVNFKYSPIAATATAYVTGTVLGTLRNDFSGWVGMQIAVGNSPLNVAELGRIVAPGNNGAHTVKLVKASDGSDVAGGAVTIATGTGTVGQFHYSSLSSPVTLAANTTYWLMSQETAGGDGWYDSDTTVTATAVAADIGYVWSAGPGIWGTFAIANRGAVPVNFKYTPTAATATAYVTGAVLGTLRNNFSGWVGMQFAVAAAPVTVSQLGRIVAPGNSSTHAVKLVKASDGSDVPGGAVTIDTNGGTVGQFQYARLTNPITLTANTTYWLVSEETFGGDGWFDADTTVTTTGVADNIGYVWSAGPGIWGTFSIGNRGPVSVNFKY